MTVPGDTAAPADRAPSDPASPHPASARAQIRITGLWSLPGANYWSRRPVTRLDLAVGTYEEIPSDAVEGFTARLVAALPGLAAHHCSPGRPGGFVERLERGTYAPHIIEHVALELQGMVGDDVGYGRTRGAERPACYVVAFSHGHAAVGRAAALQATALVRDAFDGVPLRPDAALEVLRAARALPDDPAPTARVRIGVCGDPDLADGELLAWLARVAPGAADGASAQDVVRVAPGALVTRGLPYAESQVAVVLDDDSAAAPAGFRAPERRVQLLTVLVDGLAPGGRLVCPAGATELMAYAAERGVRVSEFG